MKTPASTHIRLKSRLVPALVLITALMQMIDSGKIWATLLVGLGLMWLVSYLWVLSLARHLTLRREMRFGWAQVGDQLEERFTLHNQTWVPAPWVEILDHSNMPGYQISQVRGVEGGGRGTWRTQGDCTRRGIFTLGPTSLRSGDPFGIYQVEIHNQARSTMMVMPPIVRLPAIEVAPGGRTGEGRPRANAPERTVSASNVREYIPGDSLHMIHWRTTARREMPFVRIFDGTPAGDWWILLDLYHKTQVGQGWDSTVEHSVILAASLADRGLGLRRAVGLVSNAQDLVWMPPQEGENQRWEILRSLALVEPGQRSLAELLERTRPSMSKNSSIIIITPDVSQEWISALVPLMWRGAIPTVLLLDAANWPGYALAGHDPRPRTQHAISELITLGVPHYLIPHEYLDRPEARPGQLGRQKWRYTPRGRAILVSNPADAAWKAMG